MVASAFRRKYGRWTPGEVADLPAEAGSHESFIHKPSLPKGVMVGFRRGVGGGDGDGREQHHVGGDRVDAIRASSAVAMNGASPPAATDAS